MIIFGGVPVNYKITEGTNLWSSTVTFDFEEAKFNLEEKKKIAAYLWDFNTFDELVNFFGQETLGEMFSSEEKAVDTAIEVGRKYIEYSDKENLKALGIETYSVTTPYNSVLYTSNLGGSIKCSFNENGKYAFKINNGKKEITKTIVINNIRQKSTGTNHKVKIDLPTYPGAFQYSIDENNWNDVTDDLEIDCEDKVYFRFNKPLGVTGDWDMYIIEKNNEFYKYYNDDNTYELYPFSGFIQYPLLLSITGWAESASDRQFTARQWMLYILGRDPSFSFYWTTPNVLNDEHLFDIPKNNEFYNKHPETAFTKQAVSQYTYEARENGEKSPIYCLDVNQDMDLVLICGSDD